MGSYNNNSNIHKSNDNKKSSSSSIEVENHSLLLQSLLGRLQLRPPFLHTNSFLSHSVDDFLSLHPDFYDDNDSSSDPDTNAKSLLAQEESKLERDIIRIILSGDPHSLNPNSGHAVSIGDHHVCVGFHDEPSSDYRVWEWHGHIMFFNDDNGYTPEYIYGNYFQRLTSKPPNPTNPVPVNDEDDDNDNNDDESSGQGDVGLRGLIEDHEDDSSTTARILRRNLNVGSTPRAIK